MKLDDLRILVQRECGRLAKLGRTEAIALELNSNGAQGLQNDCHECPLARQICDTLMVSTGKLEIGRHECWWNDEWLCAFQEGLGVLADFVWEFDAGRFPFLIQEQPCKA